MKKILLKIAEAIAILFMLCMMAIFCYLPFLHDYSRDYYEARQCICPQPDRETRYDRLLDRDRFIDSLRDANDDSIYIISDHDGYRLTKHHGKYQLDKK